MENVPENGAYSVRTKNDISLLFAKMFQVGPGSRAGSLESAFGIEIKIEKQY